MSVKALTYVWEHSKQKGAPLLVLLAIADSANDDGFCWLGMTKLARKSRQTPNNTRWNIQKIEHDGEIIVYERKYEDDPGMNRSNLYKIIMPHSSSEPPPDLKGNLRRREARVPRTRKNESTTNIESTPLSNLGVPPSQNREADPLDDPSLDPKHGKDSPNGGIPSLSKKTTNGTSGEKEARGEATHENTPRPALHDVTERMLGLKSAAYPLIQKWVNFLTGNTPEFSTPRKGDKPRRNGVWYEYQIIPGMEAAEIGAFGRWYRSTHPGIDLPSKCETMNLHVSRFRAAADHDLLVAVYRRDLEVQAQRAAQTEQKPAATPVSDEPITDEQRAEAAAMMDALTVKLGGK